MTRRVLCDVAARTIVRGPQYMDDDGVHQLLVIINGITTVLFVLSEILGMSSCEYNGVIHFIIGDCMCKKKKIYVSVQLGEEEEVLLPHDI